MMKLQATDMWSVVSVTCNMVIVMFQSQEQKQNCRHIHSSDSGIQRKAGDPYSLSKGPLC